MNRRRLFLIAFVISALLVLLWLAFRPVHEMPQVQAFGASPSAMPTSSETKDASSTHELPKNRAQAVQEERAKQAEAFFNAFKTRIDFFGKVIDERGQPIPGAAISYIVATSSLAGSPTVIGQPTDAEGRFSIIGEHGAGIAVMVEHPNYYKTDSKLRQFTYAGTVPSDEPTLPTAQNPAIFVLRRKGKAVPLIHHTFDVRLPLDGTPVNVDLRNGKRGGGSESIILTLKSDGNTLARHDFHPFDWSLRIQVPSGGMQERTNRLQFQAPSEGYQPEWLVAKAASLPRAEWNSAFENEFFVLLPSGIYARFQIRAVAVRGGCSIESFLNPEQGSRNLEYDPAKQINPP